MEHGAELVLAELIALGPEDEDEAEDDEADPEGWAADVDVLLAERRQRALTRAEVALPAQLSVSQLVELAAAPDALAARLRRPLPYQPNPLARRGTAFHAWVERGSAPPGCWIWTNFRAPRTAGPRRHRSRRVAGGLPALGWANRSPVEVEVPFETAVGAP